MKKNRGTGLVYQPHTSTKAPASGRRPPPGGFNTLSEAGDSASPQVPAIEGKLEEAPSGAVRGLIARQACRPEGRQGHVRGPCTSLLDEYRVRRGVVLSAWRTRWAICASSSAASWRLRSRTIASGPIMSWRQEQRAASATIDRELAALRRAFRLAQKAGMVAFRPEISTLREERQPREFFEADQYSAVLENLAEYLKPAIQTAFITGWRIKWRF